MWYVRRSPPCAVRASRSADRRSPREGLGRVPSTATEPRDDRASRTEEGDPCGDHVPDPWRLRGGGAVGHRHARRRGDRGRRLRRLHGQGPEGRSRPIRSGQKPRLVTNWTQFEQLYGGFTPGAMLPHSVYGYFNNGGALAYIVRIPHTEPADESGHAGAARPPTARSARPSRSRPSSRTPTSPSPSRPSRRPTTPTTTPADVPRRRHRERRASRSRPSTGSR